MPMYVFKCDCGVVSQELRTMESRNLPLFCWDCGKQMERDVRAEQTNTPLQEFHTPIEMHSIAPTNQTEHDQLVKAGAEMTRDGVPIARNRHEKMRLLKLVGHVEMS